jgi:hypothetical protein
MGGVSAGGGSEGGGSAGGGFSGGSGGGADTGDASGARDPQRIRTFMGGPLSELRERAATSTACRRAPQN